MIPDGFGFAWGCPATRGRWVAPLGVNIVLRGLRIVWIKLLWAWPLPHETAGEVALERRIRPLVEHAVQRDRVRVASLIRHFGGVAKVDPVMTEALVLQMLGGSHSFHMGLDLFFKTRPLVTVTRVKDTGGTPVPPGGGGGGLSTRPTED